MARRRLDSAVVQRDIAHLVEANIPPDFVCDPAGAVPYDTVGVINGMKNLPATFTPEPRLGAGLDETLATLQIICDE